MSISENAKKRLIAAVTSLSVAEELIAAIDAMGSGPASMVTAIGATTNVPAAACAGAATPSATDVNTAIDTVAAVIETRLDVIEGKINAIISALTAASLMSAT